jgi:hypothetical protein
MPNETSDQTIKILKKKYIAHVKRRKINELIATGKMTDELHMKYMGETEMVFLLREFTENGNLIGDNEYFIKELDNFINYDDNDKVMCIYNLEALLKEYFVDEPQLSEEEEKEALKYFESNKPKSKNVNSSTSNKPKNNSIKGRAKDFANRLFKRGGSMSRKTKKSKKRRTNRK